MDDNRTSNHNNSNTTSQEAPTVAVWGWVPISAIIVMISALILNSTALLRFLTDRTLWTPFNLLFANLLFTNVAFYIMLGPLDFINSLYTRWWLGNGWCTVYMYALWVVSLVVMFTHPLIAINRLWAVSSPVTYRNFNTNRFILGLCIGAWVLAHIVALPGVIRDALYYRSPVETDGCYINLNSSVQNTWEIVVQCFCILPELIVVVVFPVITHKLRTRKRIRAQQPFSQDRFVPSLDTRRTTGGNSHELDDIRGAVDKRGGNDGAALQYSNQEKRKHPQGYLFLCLLTASVFILWTPDNICYTMQISDSTTLSIVLLLYNMGGVIDPILLTLSLKDFRESFKKVFFR